MWAGRTEEASTLAELAQRIGRDIASRNKLRLNRINPKRCCNDMWAAVRQLTGRCQNTSVVNRITADTLNQHYASLGMASV